MDKLDFWTVKSNYVDELKKVDHKIPDIHYDTNNKFVTGVVFDINGLKYYAPVSSFNKKQATNELILNEEGKPISSVRFSFMFPIPDTEIFRKEIKSETNTKYQRLLMQELKFCNDNIARIIKKAAFVYHKVTVDKDPFFILNCCDFKALETACLKYASLQNSTQDK